MMAVLHVASGAALGALARTPVRAALVGAVSHAAGDYVRHWDMKNGRRFEVRTGLAMLAVLALRHGPLSAPVVGAACASAPDLEHIVRLPRPGGRKLYPSHRFEGWHRPGGLSVATQLVLAGILLGAVLAQRRRA
jgi:hypothetical protein